MPDSPLIACCECDLLQRVIAVPPHTAARCRRCDAVLYRNTDGGLDRALALSIAAIALFVIGNLFPIVGIEVRGEYVEMTLIGAVQTLYVQQELLVATLVLATVVAAPTFELIALCYLLLPLHYGRPPRHLPFAFRILQRVREWSLVDVFLLGMLVTLIKLKPIVTVVPGVALWALGGAMLLLAAVASTIDVRELWARADSLR